MKQNTKDKCELCDRLSYFLEWVSSSLDDLRVCPICKAILGHPEGARALAKECLEAKILRSVGAEEE